MKRVLSAQEMRTIDASAPDFGISTHALMSRAGEALAQEALRDAARTARFFVFCGPGNNGGDGFVATGIISALGRKVQCELAGDEKALRGDAATHYEALIETGFELSERIETVPGRGDVVIDALLGTGLNRAPEGTIAEAIERIQTARANGARVVSADLPSGVQSDTGQIFEPAVQADATVSFAWLKRGQVIEPGVSRCGKIEVVDIGLTADSLEQLVGPATWLLEEADAKKLLPPRSADTNKGSFGHVLVVAGSPGKTGAAALSALAALRGGAGLVSVATRASALPWVMVHASELMGVSLGADGPIGVRDLNALLEAADKKAAIVIGPGIERGDDTHRLLGDFLEETSVPVVLDADALNALVGHLDVLQRAKADLILTPHPGEFARLIDRSVKDVQADRIELARAFATSHQIVLVLKGARTVIARPDGTVFINPTGNSGMATGGTGDVLSGLLGALLGQKLSSEDAAIVGVWVHGMAGDLVKARTGELGLIASDLISGFSEVWTRWQR